MTTTYCVLYALIGGLAISLGYHRCLCHSSFKTYKWLEYLLVLIGLPTGTPVQWVATHRAHHAFSDREGDPHSINVQGFWYAQVGKYFRSDNVLLCVLYSLSGPLRILINGVISPRIDKEYYKFGRDILQDPFYAWLAKPLPYFLVSATHFVVTITPMYLLEGWWGIGWLWATIVVMYNIGDASDTISHGWGERLPGANHKATNLRWYALATWGDGWHANHHSLPESAQHGMFPGQYDGCWNVIQWMEKRGHAWDVKRPDPADVEALRATEKAA